MMKNISLAGVSIVLLICSHLVSLKGYSQLPSTRPVLYAIKGVNVITMLSSQDVLENANVVISNGLIQSINGPIPSEARIIDGKGKWLMPGLIDMHVHLISDFYLGPKNPIKVSDIRFNTQDIMTPFIANGVTTILDLNSNINHFVQKKEIEKGYVIGPRMALSALIDGGEGQGRNVNNPELARQVVRSAKAEGYDFVKVYAYLNAETYKAIIDESNKLGLKVIGHIPDAFHGTLKDAFVPGLGLVAHAEELSNYAVKFNEEEADKLVKLLKNNGSWLSPTLVTIESILGQVKSLNELKALPSLKYVHPLLQSKWLTANTYNKMSSQENIAHFDAYAQFNRLLVKACKANGVPVLAGTDAGVSGLVAGFSMHDELELLVKAGLTPQEALNSATLLSAQWLGVDKHIGSVETGKFADLILLDQNPLVEVKNTRKIAGVFINGHWLDHRKLNAMLFDLAARNTADKAKFDWKTIMKKKP